MDHRIAIGSNLRKSPFFEATVEAGVESFSVYNHMLLPASFGDPEEEYRLLTEGVALWDVAAQRQVEVAGPDAEALLQYLSTREVGGMAVGQGRYLPLCNHEGLLINDPVLLKLAEDCFWLSLADSDIGLWAEATARAKGMAASVVEPDASPLAIQGPKAEALARALFGDWVGDLRYFWFQRTELEEIPLLLARSGWSKQGGFELYLLDADRGTELWRIVQEAGRAFGIGPGAPNDVERIESGLLSYGADARLQSDPANPFELGLGKLVHLDKGDFIGRVPLRYIAREGVHRRRVGVFIEGPPLAAVETPLDILSGARQVGRLSDLAFSPRLGRTIGIAMLAVDATDPSVVVDGERRALEVTTLPFPTA